MHWHRWWYHCGLCHCSYYFEKVISIKKKKKPKHWLCIGMTSSIIVARIVQLLSRYFNNINN